MNAFRPQERSFWLAQVCEANYRRLLDLIPDLAAIPKTAVARVEGKPSLHLAMLERSAYTLTLELTHCFTWEFDALREPAVKIRVYLDARAAEALSDRERPFVHDALGRGRDARGVMDYKWTLNYFLSRWLDHCIAANYRFGLAHAEREPRRAAA
jgi:uncharacterized protein YqiB (DUF1249 family)